MLEHLDLKGSSVRDSSRESLVKGGKVMVGTGARVQPWHLFLIVTRRPIKGMKCQHFGNTDLVFLSNIH